MGIMHLIVMADVSCCRQRRRAGRGIDGEGPLLELLCGGGSEPLHRVEIGVTAYLTYDLRDTCRVVFHRERIPAVLARPSPLAEVVRISGAEAIFRPALGLIQGCHRACESCEC